MDKYFVGTLIPKKKISQISWVISIVSLKDGSIVLGHMRKTGQNIILWNIISL